MQKAQAALTEFRTHRHCWVRLSHMTRVWADGGDSSFWKHFLAWTKETAEAESQALPTAQLLPTGDSRGQLWTRTVFQLLSGHESRTPEQTVITHPGERQVWPKKEDSREEKGSVWNMLRWRKHGDCFIRHNTFHRYSSLSLSFPPTQKARSIMESWNTKA